MSNTNNIAVTITGSGKITACIEGIIHTIDATHPNYSKALQCVKDSDWNGFLDAVDLTRKVKDFILNKDVQIVDGSIIYKGEVVHNTLTKRVISFMQQDLPFKPLLNFLINLMENPSKRAVDELYDFLDVGELPITEDGHFLAFKNVKSDYKDIHSGTFDNSVGKVCEMRRNQVDEDKDRTCSYGLHFCSIAYLPHFSDSCGGHTMIVKINPKDVVAIPADYNNTKGRTCRYEVIGEYTEDWRSKLGRGENGWDADLYDEDGDEYDDEDQEPFCHDTEEGFNENCPSIGCKVCEDEYDREMKINDYSDGDSGDCDTEDNGCCGGGCHNDCTGDTTASSDFGIKPNGHKFHNVRDALGKFIKAIKDNS